MAKTRSTIYRERAKAIRADPMLRLYADMAKGLRAFRRKTLDGYCNLAIWGGIDPKTVREFVLRGERRDRAALARAEHQKRAMAKREKAAELKASGKKKKDIADEIGITARGLRKPLKTQK